MKIKTTVSEYLTHVGIAVIQKTEEQDLVRLWLKKGNPCALLVKSLWETGWKFLKKLRIELHVIQQSRFGTSPEEIKSVSWWDIHTSMFTVALFIITKIWKQSTCLRSRSRPWLRGTGPCAGWLACLGVFVQHAGWVLSLVPRPGGEVDLSWQCPGLQTLPSRHHWGSQVPRTQPALRWFT